MACNQCPLNIASENFRPSMYEALPLHAKAIFVCRSATRQGLCADLFTTRQLCARDLWVLAFIGRKDVFAVEKATLTLDALVSGGHAELLCHLFDNAGYETRRALWSRMTSHYPDRLYMFDALFEKESLPPADSGELPANMHIYRHSLLFGNGQANEFVKDL